MTTQSDDDTLIPDPQVAKRYSRSLMSLWRWDRNPALNFPKPVRIRGRKFRKLSELRAWEKQRAAEVA